MKGKPKTLKRFGFNNSLKGRDAFNKQIENQRNDFTKKIWSTNDDCLLKGIIHHPNRDVSCIYCGAITKCSQFPNLNCNRDYVKCETQSPLSSPSSKTQPWEKNWLAQLPKHGDK